MVAIITIKLPFIQLYAFIVAFDKLDKPYIKHKKNIFKTKTNKYINKYKQQNIVNAILRLTILACLCDVKNN